MPTVSVLENWASAVPAAFQFVLKAPGQITHRKRLKDAGESLSNVLEIAGKLKKRLGPLFFQLPPNFQKDAARLRTFLALLPRGRRVAFEFRHPSWFDNEVFGLLRKRRVALCIADADDNLEVPLVATTEWGYLRLRRTDYDDKASKKWAKEVRRQAWRDAFVFFKHDNAGKGPAMAKRFLELAE